MRIVLAALLALGSACALAQPVFKWTDAQGLVHYGDAPPSNAAVEQVAIEPPPPDAGLPATPASSSVSAPIAETVPQAQSLDIVMYSRADCGYCAKARRYFAARGIGYREKDVERYAQSRAEWKRLGGQGVPLFVINGQVSSGFSEGGMSRRLAAYGW